jgi:hypothetical protein
VAAISRTAADRRTTYVFVLRPQSSTLERLRGRTAIERLLDALPGIDVRICADPVELAERAR